MYFLVGTPCISVFVGWCSQEFRASPFSIAGILGQHVGAVFSGSEPVGHFPTWVMCICVFVVGIILNLC